MTPQCHSRNIRAVAETFASLDLFARFDPSLPELVARAGRKVTLGSGQWVYGEGDAETGVCAVLEGSVRLEAAVGDRSVLIGLVPAGRAFGQSARRGGGPRIVTARAGVASRVLLIGDGALERIAAERPAMWPALSALVYAQLDASVHASAQMLALPPRGRVAARLLALAHEGMASATQADLAELTGLTRKAVNAHLAALEAAGAIRRGYRKILLADPTALARLIS